MGKPSNSGVSKKNQQMWTDIERQKLSQIKMGENRERVSLNEWKKFLPQFPGKSVKQLVIMHGILRQ